MEHRGDQKQISPIFSMKQKPIAIIGVGNALMGDEGIGIHAISYLQQFEWPHETELIDAGVPGPSLLYLLEKRKLSIIIDCGDFGGQPGEVLVVPQERLKKAGDTPVSLHETSLLGTLALAEELEMEIGPVILICIQPKTLEMSTNISDEVSHSLPKIKSEILRILPV